MTIDKMVTELVVFDFDETIVNCNSDTFINILAPNGKMPKSIWDSYLNENDWTIYMHQVFLYLHQQGVREEHYKTCLIQMPFVDSMKKLIYSLAHPPPELNKRFEIIILSDANTFFINCTLEHHKLTSCIKKVISNPAHFDKNGCLQIQRYEDQNWCSLSARNLCKGEALREYIANRAADNVNFSRVSYAGDGANDLCPSLKLSNNDNVFPRFGYPLHKLVGDKCKTKELKAKCYPFVNGNDIWNVLSSK